MTNNTQFKTLLNTWLNQKKPMITPSTHASFTLIAENHLIPHFGKRKIGSITEPDIQSYISYLYESGRLDKSGGLTVKTIRDVILVLRLANGVCLQGKGDTTAQLGLDRVPKRAWCQESGIAIQRSGASSYSVHLHEPE